MSKIYDNLNQKISNKTVIAGIIGLGYVGLPLMHSICKSGINVIGFDTDEEKIAMLKNGEVYLDTVDAKIISEHTSSKKFDPTSDMSRLSEVDVVIICVPTPLGVHREPDLSYVTDTAKAIGKHLREGQLIVLESTTYPGTTNGIMKPVLEETGKKSSKDFYLAYSPEREDPGNPDYETSSIPKIVGGDGDEALELAINFYRLFLDKVISASSIDTAEAVKITENVFRAVNIALVNELKVIYDKMGIDIWEVIDAAKTKPFGYMPFYPGPGLGGHCIPIDPFYLSWKAKEYNTSTRFIELAGEINVKMPEYVYSKVVSALGNKHGKSVNKSKILIMGIAYKKNINDQRESPAFPLIKILKDNGAIVSYYDPLIPSVNKMRQFPEFNNMKSIEWNKDNISKSDAVIIVTDHDEINYNELSEWSSLIIDTRNAMHGKNCSEDKIVKA